MPEPSPPSDWLLSHERWVRETTPLGPALDLACGRGRHARAVAAWGQPVIAVDRDPASLAEVGRNETGTLAAPIHALRADLEAAPFPPFAPQSFGSILVFRYLHRPLCAALEALLAPGGRLIYETFTIHQRTLGYGPKNAAFLLDPGELPELFSGLEIEAVHEGLSAGDRPLHLAGLVARRPA